jgi:pimeloyl-ACP methyl ester carboxylesterase/DNA-binding CsgD family transcriptional regulator
MKPDEVLARQAATQVLGGLYAALADHSQYEMLFAAWDEFLESGAVESDVGQVPVWQSLFREHFSRVGAYIDSVQLDHRESPLSFVNRQVVPSAVVDMRLQVIAANEAFNELVGERSGTTANRIADALQPNDGKRLRKLAVNKHPAEPCLFTVDLETIGSTFAVARRADLLESSTTDGEALLSIKLVRPVWTAGLSALLQSAYRLTDAEIDVLKALVETGGVQAIAGRRNRSVRTVRTQLTHVFSKLGVESQTELALFLATLANLVGDQVPKDNAVPTKCGDSDHFWVRLVNHSSGVTQYAVYGDPGGRPILFIQPTNPPEMSPEFRSLCLSAGYKIISPYKPGSAETTPRPDNYGADRMSVNFADILDKEGHQSAIFAGQCSGGVYALEMARNFPHRCHGVLLVDTGVPFQSRRDLMRLPRSMRRTFLPARFLPEILPVPHRIIASNFRSSPAGEARVIDYFFEDSPADRDLTRTRKRYYDITRDIIHYSFEDVDRLVSDVCLWASDWSQLLEQVSQRHNTVFLHGTRNTLFDAERIGSRIEAGLRAELVAAEGAGQLLLYTHPEKFSEAVSVVLAEH